MLHEHGVERAFAERIERQAPSAPTHSVQTKPILPMYFATEYAMLELSETLLQ